MEGQTGRDKDVDSFARTPRGAGTVGGRGIALGGRSAAVRSDLNGLKSRQEALHELSCPDVSLPPFPLDQLNLNIRRHRAVFRILGELHADDRFAGLGVGGDPNWAASSLTRRRSAGRTCRWAKPRRWRGGTVSAQKPGFFRETGFLSIKLYHHRRWPLL